MGNRGAFDGLGARVPEFFPDRASTLVALAILSILV
jgi:hypothetical protein